MSVYKTFPQSNLIREWDKLVKMKREEVVKLYGEWKEIHKENEETRKRLYEEKNEKLGSERLSRGLERNKPNESRI